MAEIRVYLLTFRRPALLRRALRSLLAQTFTDWVCELHNDAPEDDEPARALAELAPGDSRFSYRRHDPTWGAVAAFNHCFRAGGEPYASLLEDDNWWEPDLLAELHAAMEADPGASLAWANMRLWRENEDSTWADTGETVWPAGSVARRFMWPVLLQAFDALHSNGAMVFRRPATGEAEVPAATPFAVVEAVRERMLPGALLLVPRVLANFALTRATARSGQRTLWVEGQLLQAGSFLERVELTGPAWDELVSQSRSALGRTNLLILMALAGIRRGEILAHLDQGHAAVRFGVCGQPCDQPEGPPVQEDSPRTLGVVAKRDGGAGRRGAPAGMRRDRGRVASRKAARSDAMNPVRMARDAADALFLRRNLRLRAIVKRAYCRARDPLGRGRDVPLEAGITLHVPTYFATSAWSGYEVAAMRSSLRWLRANADSTFVDVGCSVAIYSLMALNASPRARVLAIDPDRVSLMTTAEFCRFADTSRLSLVQGFVADTGSPGASLAGALRATQQMLGATRLRSDPTAVRYLRLDSPVPGEAIPRYTLDELLAGHAPERPMLVKIDIEGAELLALRGAGRLLRERRPSLLLSVHPQFLPSFGHTVGDVSALLGGQGYSWTVLASDHEEHWWCEPQGAARR